MDAIIQSARRKAEKLAQCLMELRDRENTQRIVFAESCTAGLVSALMGQVPGVSEFLCGSAVCYRASVKQQWLGVNDEIIEKFSTESLETTVAMATGVLNLTTEATCSAAITGDLGPGAPADKDGCVSVVVAFGEADEAKPVFAKSIRLKSQTRIERQYEAAGLVIDAMCEFLSSGNPIEGGN